MTLAFLVRLDPRIKILSTIALGILTWHSGLVGLGCYFVVLATLCYQLRSSLPGQSQVIKSYGWFLLLWSVAKVGVDLWSGMSAGVAASGAGMLAFRLTCLLLAGLVLALCTSPRQLGMALTWFLRPVMGKLAWKGALAFALMVHFLPLTWLTLAQVREAVKRRCPDLGLFRRMLLMGQCSIRNLGQKTWNQTLAVACRRLDNQTAWKPVFQPAVVQWVWFSALVILFTTIAQI